MQKSTLKPQNSRVILGHLDRSILPDKERYL